MSERHHDQQPMFGPSSEQLDDWRISLTTDMSEVKTMLRTLTGNGQPGTIGKMEARLSVLETAKNRLAGAIALASLIGGWLLRGHVGGGH